MAPEAGEYQILVSRDLPWRVRLNGKWIIGAEDKFAARSVELETTVALTKDPVPILVETVKNAGNNRCHLRWQPPHTTAPVMVPGACLFHDPKSPDAPKP